jgi:hypothetical protein
MSTRPMPIDLSDDAASPRFSLIRGGPWFHLQRQLGLMPAGDGFTAGRRAALLAGIAWVPAVALMLIERAAGHVQAADPVFGMLGAHARLLVALPLFIAAEPMFERGLGIIVTELTRLGLVAPASMPAFRATLRRLERVRDSWLVFAVIAMLAASMTWAWFLVGGAPDRMPLAFRPQAGALQFGYGGMWYLAVAKPLADLFLLHWILRLALVSALLWRLSRLQLDLVPAHPDAHAGLGFLEDVPMLFIPVLVGISLTLAGELAHEMLYRGETLAGAVWLIAAYVVVAVVVLLAPLLAFVVPLSRARLLASIAYGALLVRYNRAVHQRWIEGRTIADDPLLSAAEIGPAVDAGSLFEKVHAIVPVPFGIQTVAMVVLAAALPILPVAAIEIPIREIFGKLAEAIM